MTSNMSSSSSSSSSSSLSISNSSSLAWMRHSVASMMVRRMHEWTPRFGHSNQIASLASSPQHDHAMGYAYGILEFYLMLFSGFVLWMLLLVLVPWCHRHCRRRRKATMKAMTTTCQEENIHDEDEENNNDDEDDQGEEDDNDKVKPKTMNRHQLDQAVGNQSAVDVDDDEDGFMMLRGGAVDIMALKARGVRSKRRQQLITRSRRIQRVFLFCNFLLFLLLLLWNQKAVVPLTRQQPPLGITLWHMLIQFDHQILGPAKNITMSLLQLLSQPLSSSSSTLQQPTTNMTLALQDFCPQLFSSNMSLPMLSNWDWMDYYLSAKNQSMDDNTYAMLKSLLQNSNEGINPNSTILIGNTTVTKMMITQRLKHAAQNIDHVMDATHLMESTLQHLQPYINILNVGTQWWMIAWAVINVILLAGVLLHHNNIVVIGNSASSSDVHDDDAVAAANAAKVRWFISWKRRWFVYMIVPFWWCLMLTAIGLGLSTTTAMIVMNADYCAGGITSPLQGSSVGTLMDVLEYQGLITNNQSSFAYQTLQYYISDCNNSTSNATTTNSINPFELLSSTLHVTEQLLETIASWQQTVENQSNGLLLDAFIGESHACSAPRGNTNHNVTSSALASLVTPVITSKLEALSRELQSAQANLLAAMDLTQCQNISPFLQKLTSVDNDHGLVCSNARTLALAWMWSILWVMLIVAMVMITFRAALYNVVIRPPPKHSQRKYQEREFEEYKEYMSKFFENANEWKFQPTSTTSATTRRHIEALDVATTTSSCSDSTDPPLSTTSCSTYCDEPTNGNDTHVLDKCTKSPSSIPHDAVVAIMDHCDGDAGQNRKSGATPPQKEANIQRCLSKNMEENDRSADRVDALFQSPLVKAKVGITKNGSTPLFESPSTRFSRTLGMWKERLKASLSHVDQRYTTTWGVTRGGSGGENVIDDSCDHDDDDDENDVNATMDRERVPLTPSFATIPSQGPMAPRKSRQSFPRTRFSGVLT